MTDAVLDLLKSKQILYSMSGKDYLTKCLNPEHNDSNPSFRIDKVTGISHCFSCGFKCNIFKFFGLLTNNTSVRVAKLKDKLASIMIDTNGLEPMEGAKSINESFRGISSATLKHFEAFSTTRVENMADRIIFPIKDLRGKTSCYVGRHLLSNGNPRYVNYPSGVTIPIFPLKFAKKYTSLVLVEGIFDMLNLYDKGLHNVACTFGTSKLYNETAEKLLSFKVVGIERIFILYDGDSPGKEAAKKIKPLIEEAGFIVEIIDLPEDTDPGDMPQDDVTSIINYIQ